MAIATASISGSRELCCPSSRLEIDVLLAFVYVPHHRDVILSGASQKAGTLRSG